MKQLFFILFLIPCLSFAQLGVNKQNPSATLHIQKKEPLPALIIEGVDTKDELDSGDRYLIIGEDGTVKKSKDEEIDMMYKFIVSEKLIIGTGLNDKQKVHLGLANSNDFPELNIPNHEKYVKNGDILLPDTGSFALTMRYTTKIMDRVSDQRNEMYFGQVLLNAYDNTNSKNPVLLDSIEMTWIYSSNHNSMSYNVTAEVHGKEGTPIKLEFEVLSRGRVSPNRDDQHTHRDPNAKNTAEPSNSDTGMNSVDKISVLMWKI